MEAACFILFVGVFRLLLLTDPSLPGYFGPRCRQQRSRLIERHLWLSVAAGLLLTLVWVLR